jgi:hypothetical protein
MHNCTQTYTTATHTHSTSLTQHTNIHDRHIHTHKHTQIRHTLTSRTHELCYAAKLHAAVVPSPDLSNLRPIRSQHAARSRCMLPGATDLIVCVGARVSELVGRVIECVTCTCVLAAAHACVKCVHAEHVSKCIRGARAFVPCFERT